MTNFARVETQARAAVVCFVLACSLVGCKKNMGGGAAGFPGVAGSSALDGAAGGAASPTLGGSAGAAGMSPVTGSGGATGAAGAVAMAGNGGGAGAGTSGSAGATGTAGGGAAGTTGASGGGAAGTGGAAGAAGMASDPSIDQCLAGVTAAGMTITDCERCLCLVGNCQPEMTALQGDTKGNALVTCSKAHMCSGECCVCGAPCDKTLGTNYGMGPCLMEAETAAGVTPGAGVLANGTTVGMQCDPASTTDNSCAHATKVAKCATDKCKSVCPAVAVPCP